MLAKHASVIGLAVAVSMSMHSAARSGDRYEGASVMKASTHESVVINGRDMGRNWAATYRVPAGSYWYDRMSGLWGLEGQPAAGQIYPGLDLGGPLNENASRGSSNVFVNGRRLTASEVAYLQQRYGYVLPGRYWLNAQFVGGVEGGPASFHLGSAAGGSGSNVSTPFGDIMSDGSCTFVHLPGGASVGAGAC